MNLINNEAPFLPRMSNDFKYTVVLDLDETLIHYINVFGLILFRHTLEEHL